MIEKEVRICQPKCNNVFMNTVRNSGEESQNKNEKLAEKDLDYEKNNEKLYIKVNKGTIKESESKHKDKNSNQEVDKIQNKSSILLKENINHNKNSIKPKQESYITDLVHNYKNLERENKIKEIFSSQGVISSSMNYKRNESPIKLKSKITSKEYKMTIFETNLNAKQETKKFRRNSCHKFSNKSGFYIE